MHCVNILERLNDHQTTHFDYKYNLCECAALWSDDTKCPNFGRLPDNNVGLLEKQEIRPIITNRADLLLAVKRFNCSANTERFS